MFYELHWYRFGTNSGNIRSVITVFPQRTDGEHDYRVWNSQLIRYAGYRLESESEGEKIMGDPISVPITDVNVL